MSDKDMLSGKIWLAAERKSHENGVTSGPERHGEYSLRKEKGFRVYELISNDSSGGDREARG